MGMAASQARYLALLARKSNCEYEGQQINQSRLALSNQSADLFNQMMGLQVPSTPSKSDYTIQKYKFSDGLNEFIIDKWNRLAEADSDGYNYVVTYHYDTEEYTGYQKYKLDPQVQFSGVTPTSSVDPDEQVRLIQAALADKETQKAAMDLAYTAYATQKQQAGKLSNYEKYYTIVCNPTGEAEKTYTYTQYDELTPQEQSDVKTYVTKLIEYGALEGDPETYDYTKVYYYKNPDYRTDSIAVKSDILNLMKEGPSAATSLPIYHVTYDAPAGAPYVSMQQMDSTVQKALNAYLEAKANYEASEDVYSRYDVPTKIGNLKLTPLSSLQDNQLNAITQIIADMKEEEIDTNLKKCFDTMQEQYTADNYIGGIYTFEMVGTRNRYKSY